MNHQSFSPSHPNAPASELSRIPGSTAAIRAMGKVSLKAEGRMKNAERAGETSNNERRTLNAECSVPKGRSKIARRFNAGSKPLPPKSRRDGRELSDVARPSRLRVLAASRRQQQHRARRPVNSQARTPALQNSKRALVWSLELLRLDRSRWAMIKFR